MQTVEVSDVEEGEILEYDIDSSGGSLDGEPALHNESSTLKKFLKGTSCGKIELKKSHLDQENIIISSSLTKEGYVNKSLKEKLKLADKVNYRKKISIYNDLKYKFDCNLSDGEYSSDEYEKTILNENRYLGTHSNGQQERERFRKKHNDHILHGTAEDIMSQIDKTICRKRHCNYKRRKSRNLKVNLENNCSLNGMDHQEYFSSRVTKNKSRRNLKRKKSWSDSDSEVCQKYVKSDFCQRKRCGRRRKEIRDHYYNDEIMKKANDETSHKKPSMKKVRDFDEVRKCLLEKLKKQKEAEEKVNGTSQNINQELRTSENQGNKSPKTSNKETTVTETDSQIVTKEGISENEADDETDLTKLRLIALASNGKRKIERNSGNNTSKAENSVSVVEQNDKETAEKMSSGNSCYGRDDEDNDFDRNELLLRAEALKTALLKKHQKRLNKLKAVESSSDNNSSGENPKTPVANPPSRNDGTVINHEIKGMENLILFNSKVDVDDFKEDLEKENGNEISTNCTNTAKIQGNEMSALSVAMPKRRRLKLTKKRKRKISALPSSIKENDNTNDLMEEDDRILRSQLLCDLIKKKSLKDLEKKSILTDSTQTSANKSVPINNKAKIILKSSSAVKSNVLNKTNISKTTKIEAPPKIPKPEIQRIIVHLGSDDSSEDESVRPISTSLASEIRESKQNEESVRASYERSVELLLSEARKKVEGEMQKAKNTTATPEAVYKHLPPSQRLEYIRLKQKIAERERQKKISRVPSGGALSSLKNTAKESVGDVVGKIVPSVIGNASRAELGSNQANTNTALMVDCNLKTSKSNAVQSEGLNIENGQNLKQNFQSVVKNIFPSSNYTHINRSAGSERTQKTFVVNKIKSNNLVRSNQKLNCKILTRKYVAPSSAESKSSKNVLISKNQALISKLKLFLRKIKIEKTLEENYDKEITKLKNQLNLVSKKRLEQRLKIKKLAEESMKIYKVIKSITDSTHKTKPGVEENKGRKNCEKVEGDVLPENKSGKEIEQETEKIENGERTKVENESKDEISKDFLVGSGCGSNEEPHETSKIGEIMSKEISLGACELSKYTSPLEVFAKSSNKSERVDPNVIMCQFDLMGICKDEECNYQHFRTA